MARSGNRYVARELADRLGMQFAFAVEFVELSLGGEEERAALPPDAVNEFGVHGGAILSRFPLERPAAVRFEFDGAWYADDSLEPRVGGRCARGRHRRRPRRRGAPPREPRRSLRPGPAAGRPPRPRRALRRRSPGHRRRGPEHPHDGPRGMDANDGQQATAAGRRSAASSPRSASGTPSTASRCSPRPPSGATTGQAANTDEPTHRTLAGPGRPQPRLVPDPRRHRHRSRGHPRAGPDGTPLSDHDLIAVIVRPVDGSEPCDRSFS